MITKEKQVQDLTRNKKEGFIIIAVSITILFLLCLTSDPTYCERMYGNSRQCSNFLMTAQSCFEMPLRHVVIAPFIITIYGFLRSQSLVKRLFGKSEKELFDSIID